MLADGDALQGMMMMTTTIIRGLRHLLVKQDSSTKTIIMIKQEKELLKGGRPAVSRWSFSVACVFLQPVTEEEEEKPSHNDYGLDGLLWPSAAVRLINLNASPLNLFEYKWRKAMQF